ncbi:fam-a protein [Plasmodium vinckei lentum]|uniref:Fam-a protein n=1 Tax=Plasmodium vinckei lentum TaxID=138297 RepID=A0A6V7S8D1_PLAVN|nr:fam-a protein [Plasmodium vinckei lentum]
MNKFYIQIVFFLLSVSVYLNNRTLATESAPGKAPKTKSKNRYATSEEIYEKNKHLLCTNPEEIIQAEKLMDEAVIHLVHHVTSKDGYKFCGDNSINNVSYYKKKHEDHTDVIKINSHFYNSNKYNKIINRIWDPDNEKLLDTGFTKRKIVRVYNSNLVMIQRRFKKTSSEPQKYFYALVKKAQISEEKTIIVMTSANINDHYPSNKEYKNTIIENANLFKTDIDSEDDIRKGKLQKTFVNIAGFLIEKKDKQIDINYVESIDEHGSI